MKKTVLHVLLLILILFMISCNSSQTPPTEDTSPDTAGTAAPEETDPQGDFEAELPNITIETYQGYQSFIVEGKLPANFIAYEQVSALGKFDSFVYQEWGNIHEYFYNLRDAVGKQTFVSVRQTKKYDYKVLRSAPDDLRICSDSGTCVWKLGLAEYLYLSGMLYSISIPCGEMTVAVTISESARLSDYPTDADTLLSRLVNRDTAEEAIQDFMNQLQQKNVKE